MHCSYGVVAHLGERIAGSDEVEGSSPFGSTKQDSRKPGIYTELYQFRIKYKSVSWSLLLAWQLALKYKRQEKLPIVQGVQKA